MKICYVGSGGVHNQRFFDKYGEKGWEVHVVVLGRSRVRETRGLTFHYLLSDVSKYLLTRFRKAAKYAVYPVEIVRGYVSLKKLLREVKPEVLHGGFVQSSGFLCALCSYHPFVLMPFGTDILIYPRRSKLQRVITKYVIKKADMIICDAESVKKEIIKLADYREEKIVVFAFGIDLSRFNPDANGSKVRNRLGWEGKKVVIMTRSFKPIYGIQHFLTSIPKIVESVPEARIILCGDGPLEDEFKSFVSSEGLTGHVHFAGSIKNEELPNYLAAAGCLRLSSLSDGTSLSLLEAMACGLPVVVTDVEANQEWVIDGVNGFIVPKTDSHKLSEKVIELLINEGLGGKFGAENLRIAQERANWDKNFEKVEQIYQALIDGLTGGNKRPKYRLKR